MKIDANNIPVKFGSDALMLCDWVDTTNFVVIGGRGVAKSTVVLARRSLRCVRLMPGAPIAIVANTYANLVDNIMPAVENGWKLDGLLEGVHYIRGKRPPEAWRRRCSVIVNDYRHVYTFWNGSVLFLGSLDNPSLLAGKSVAHLLFDEAKFASDVKAARVMPILRGDAVTYGRCHLYGGVTITTDMPDVTEGEFDWFFRYAAEMDPPRIIRIIQAASELNRMRLRFHALERKGALTPEKVERFERSVAYYENGLLKARKGQTFFINISSLVNIDILTVDYVKRMYNGALELHEFLKSVLGMRPGLRRDARFYVAFDSRHKYTDGTRSGVPAFRCEELVYLDPTKPLDGGMDFGNMLSLVIGQEDGPRYRVHKNFYELPPGWFRELADEFLTFFAGHKCKTLRLYYDRAGNNFQKQGEDYASKIKDAIEKDATGRRTGWTVELMSRKQSTLLQSDEYNFMLELMKGENPRLPALLVDEVNCPEMVSSIELAKATMRFARGAKYVAKVKKSEKLELKKLPRLSTNFSDAFKYLMMRRRWIDAVKARDRSAPGDSALVAQWFESRNK